MRGGPGALGFVLAVAAALLGQWLLVQAGLWILAIAYGWRLRFQAGPDGGAPPQRERQFGIRQLMIVTAIVAVLLGTGRIILTNLPPGISELGRVRHARLIRPVGCWFTYMPTRLTIIRSAGNQHTRSRMLTLTLANRQVRWLARQRKGGMPRFTDAGMKHKSTAVEASCLRHKMDAVPLGIKCF